MEGVGARLGRTSARYGPATTFTGPVRKWRKEWVPIAAAAAAAADNGGTASSAGTGSGSGSRGNNLHLFKWTPVNGANGGGDGEQAAAAETAAKRRRYVPVSVVEEQNQESAKSDDENKANDDDPSSEPSNGKADINDTPMDESPASDEDAGDSGKNGGGTDLNLTLGLKDLDGDNEGDTGEQQETAENPHTANRFKRKSVTTDLEMRIYRTMGISRDSLHKRRATGGRKKHWRKKKQYEMGRQPANTKLSSHVAVRGVRVRGGNYKFRALRLDHGTFSWGSEATSRKVRILDVVYNASNNELVRTQTLVKNAIIQVDAAPFKAWYQTHYGVELGGKGKEAEVNKLDERKASNNVKRKIKQRLQGRKLDTHLVEQFSTGRLLACIASRPGQSGRCDGYILEGKELEFYIKKLQKKKSGGKA